MKTLRSFFSAFLAFSAPPRAVSQTRKKIICVVLTLACCTQVFPFMQGAFGIASSHAEIVVESDNAQHLHDWEQIYGNVMTWGWQTNAAYVLTYGCDPASGLHDTLLTSLPDDTDFPYEQALQNAVDGACRADSRISHEQLQTSTVGSAFFRDYPGIASFLDANGASQKVGSSLGIGKLWYIKFLDSESNSICDAYLDGITGEVLMVVVFLDMKDAYDEEGIVWVFYP